MITHEQMSKIKVGDKILVEKEVKSVRADVDGKIIK